MSWRDEIADYAKNGDVEGVLKIFDELWTDRHRVRSLNEGYLKHIRELKGSASIPAKTVVAEGDVLKAHMQAREAATGALKGAKASRVAR